MNPDICPVLKEYTYSAVYSKGKIHELYDICFKIPYQKISILEEMNVKAVLSVHLFQQSVTNLPLVRNHSNWYYCTLYLPLVVPTCQLRRLAKENKSLTAKGVNGRQVHSIYPMDTFFNSSLVFIQCISSGTACAQLKVILVSRNLDYFQSWSNSVLFLRLNSTYILPCTMSVFIKNM